MKKRTLFFAALCTVGLTMPLSNAHAEWTLHINSRNEHPPTLVNNATIQPDSRALTMSSQPPIAVAPPAPVFITPQPVAIAPPPPVVVAAPRPNYQVVVYENSYYNRRPDGWYRSYHPQGTWVRVQQRHLPPRFAVAPRAPEPRFAPPHRRFDDRRGVELRVRY
uniref:Uncharacterized protein n=1 Tax=Chlorobium chlorochromatii (strain CaD3) TaxID=340177 RepID=Q3ASI8_CHLCH